MNPRTADRSLTRTAAFVLALTLWAVMGTSPALARSSDRQQEAEIEAGHWLDDPAQGFQVFSRGVTLVQGTLRVTADKATVYRADSGGFARILLEGNPVHWQEEMDDGGQMSAKARTIDYQVEDELVVLRRQVVVIKERDEITGDEIRYNLATQRLDAGAEGDGRVRIRFTPTKKPDPS